MKVQSIVYGLDLVNGADVQSVAGLEPNKESEWFYNKPKTEEKGAPEKPLKPNLANNHLVQSIVNGETMVIGQNAMPLAVGESREDGGLPKGELPMEADLVAEETLKLEFVMTMPALLTANGLIMGNGQNVARLVEKDLQARDVPLM